MHCPLHAATYYLMTAVTAVPGIIETKKKTNKKNGKELCHLYITVCLCKKENGLNLKFQEDP